jgi:GT2 family glycosyltransferase
MARADVTAVTVTLNGLPWIERCLESLRGLETIVVDHGSTDGTLELVRERFPEVQVIEQENRGYGAGLNAGMRVASGRYYLIVNSDAWFVGDAVERLAEAADTRPDAAVVAPRLSNPDGTLQRSVRGFPTLWRLATEYLFLRKLAPRSRVLNAFYAGGFDHDEPREVEWVMGACFLVRREAADAVGLFDEDFFLFSEETDWLYRFHLAGWKTWFFPGAEVVHVGGGTHGGRMYVENVRGHVRFFAKHRGQREAERARRLLLAGARLRALLFRGERGRTYREAARWLASGSVGSLLG